MVFTLESILSFLEKNQIHFTILNGTTNPKKEYTLASSRNIIKDGIYFSTTNHVTSIATVKESIIITNENNNTASGNIYLLVKNPQLVHYLLAGADEKKRLPFIHPSAIINTQTIIHPSAYIGPFCVLGNCEIGENVVLHDHVTINDKVIIKKNSEIESYTVIGARGMAWIWNDEGERIMQPQSGGVIIEENCIIGTGITIVRGSLSENTVIGRGTVIAHGTRIGHGSIVGKEVHFANNVSLAGNAIIGDRSFLGSGCVISSNVVIGEGCIVGAGAVVHKSFTDEYCTIAGVPAVLIKTNNFNSKPKGAPQPFKKSNNDNES